MRDPDCFLATEISRQEIEYLDDATARVITLANRFVKNMPVMILGIGSGGALEKGWDEHIKLGPLSTTGVEALIRHILKGSIPANLIQYVMSATAGTPWHIVDIVRRTVEEKQLLFVDGRWHLNEAALLPEAVSVYEARSRRIRELPKELSEALRAAAGGGKDAGLGAGSPDLGAGSPDLGAGSWSWELALGRAGESWIFKIFGRGRRAGHRHVGE